MKKLILTLVLSAAVLFGAALALNGIAAQNAQKEHLWLMQTVLPGSESFTVEPYSGDDANIVSVHKAENGFVVEAVTYGYAGDISMLIGVNTQGHVTGLVVTEAHETLGLGSKILTDHEFLAQFLNGTGSFAVASADAFSGATGETDPADSVNVDAISGATVSSKAVIRCVNSAIAYVTGADASSGATSWGG